MGSLNLSYPSSYQQLKTTRHPLFGLGSVLVFHAVLIWFINSGLGREFVQTLQAPVAAVLLEEQRPPPPPPPPPQKRTVAPTPQSPPSYVPPVETAVRIEPSPNAIQAVSHTPQPVTQASEPVSHSAPAVVAPVAVPVRVPGTVISANCEKPEYPSVSRRQEEEGTVHLRFLIDVNGRVLQSEIEKSSGFKRLDEAAKNGLSKCKFNPPTADGKPEQGWASMKYNWRLD